MTGVFGCYWFAQGKLILRPHLYDRIGRECIFGHRQVARRRAFANPRGGIVLRAVARAEITAVFAARLAFLVAQRHAAERSEEHTSELQSLMRISYAVFCLNKKKINSTQQS